MRRDDAELLKARDVVEREHLSVLDAQAGIIVWNFLEDTLVDVERLAVRGVAYRVNPDLEARAVRLVEHVVELFVGPLAVALCPGRSS